MQTIDPPPQPQHFYVNWILHKNTELEYLHLLLNLAVTVNFARFSNSAKQNWEHINQRCALDLSWLEPLFRSLVTFTWQKENDLRHDSDLKVKVLWLDLRHDDQNDMSSFSLCFLNFYIFWTLWGLLGRRGIASTQILHELITFSRLVWYGWTSLEWIMQNVPMAWHGAGYIYHSRCTLVEGYRGSSKFSRRKLICILCADQKRKHYYAC